MRAAVCAQRNAFKMATGQPLGNCINFTAERWKEAGFVWPREETWEINFPFNNEAEIHVLSVLVKVFHF